MGAWQGPLGNGWHQQPKAVTRRSTANIAQLNQGSPSQTLRLASVVGTSRTSRDVRREVRKVGQSGHLITSLSPSRFMSTRPTTNFEPHLNSLQPAPARMWSDACGADRQQGQACIGERERHAATLALPPPRSMRLRRWPLFPGRDRALDALDESSVHPLVSKGAVRIARPLFQIIRLLPVMRSGPLHPFR
jgi:hypothetical protein